MDICCEECGHPYSEKHHIIFRKQQKAMENCPLNFIYLCYEHHRGSKHSPHMVRKVDLKYKVMLQEKLEKEFSDKEIFNEDEIKEILKITPKDVIKLIKPICRTIDGYIVEEIIKQCLGGKMYK